MIFLKNITKVNKLLLISSAILGFGVAWPEIAYSSNMASLKVQERGSGCRFELSPDVPTIKYKTMTLSSPDRYVLDIAGNNLKVGVVGKCSLVKNIRKGNFNPQWFRIVFDMEKEFPINALQTSNGSFIFTMGKFSEDKNPKPSRFSLSGNNDADNSRLVDKYSPERGSGNGNVINQKTVPQVNQAKAATAKSTKPIIVIDAGHGGIDPGAIGSKGTKEKDVVLKYALALRDALQKTGRYTARLTRNNDSYVKLYDRQNLARELDGDLFLSLHADAAPEKSLSGLSVYTLSEQAAEKIKEAAAKENREGDFISGVNLSDKSKDVKGILFDLVQRDSTNKSAEFAGIVIDEMRRKGIKILSHTHRFAGFVVLKSPDVPAILIETGFISNPVDEVKLQTEAYRTKIVEAIVASIDAHFQTN